MRVGVIGAGNMGSAFARRLSGAGHDVLITSKHPEHAKKVADALKGRVRAVPLEQLAKQVEIIIAAVPFAQQAVALLASGDLSGKPVIEISNPLTDDMSDLAVGHTTSAAEEIAKTVRDARVVKAFNTIFSSVLASAQASGSRVQVLYAGDDDGAKAAVRTLIDSIGFEAIDAGPLRNARYLEPLGMLNIYLGYMAKMGTDIAPAIRKLSGQADDARTARTTRAEEGRPSAG